MKKLLLAASILAVTSMSAQADTSSTVLQWQGFVGGVISGTEIILTGANGGDIEVGDLTVASDGTFVSEWGTSVEVRKVSDSEIYTGIINWSLSGSEIDHTAYDEAGLSFYLDGDALDSTAIEGPASNEVVVTVDFADASLIDVAAVLPEDSVIVRATITAEVGA